MNLGFDIDGVISDFAKTLARVVKKHYNLKLDETEICLNKKRGRLKILQGPREFLKA